jgi:hypothetical protein
MLAKGQETCHTREVPDQNETLRWPTRLNRGAIQQRLELVRDAARSENLPELTQLFPDPSTMTPAELGTAVVAALSWLQDKPQHRAITMQLEMVAMNLKNLK